MSDIVFLDGLIVKKPEGAPDFVIAKLSIKREELITFLQNQEGDWLNADIKESKAGKFYAALDTWKPDGQQQRQANPDNTNTGATTDDPSDPIPF